MNKLINYYTEYHGEPAEPSRVGEWDWAGGGGGGQRIGKKFEKYVAVCQTTVALGRSGFVQGERRLAVPSRLLGWRGATGVAEGAVSSE